MKETVLHFKSQLTGLQHRMNKNTVVSGVHNFKGELFGNADLIGQFPGNVFCVTRITIGNVGFLQTTDFSLCDNLTFLYAQF